MRESSLHITTDIVFILCMTNVQCMCMNVHIAGYPVWVPGSKAELLDLLQNAPVWLMYKCTTLGQESPQLVQGRQA